MLKFAKIKKIPDSANILTGHEFKFAELKEDGDLLIFYRKYNSLYINLVDQKLSTRFELYFTSLYSKESIKKFVYNGNSAFKNSQFVTSLDRIFIKDDKKLDILKIVKKKGKENLENDLYTFESEIMLENFVQDLYDVKYAKGKYYIFLKFDTFLLVYDPSLLKFEYLDLCVRLDFCEIIRIIYFEVKENSIRGVLEVGKEKIKEKVLDVTNNGAMPFQIMPIQRIFENNPLNNNRILLPRINIEVNNQNINRSISIVGKARGKEDDKTKIVLGYGVTYTRPFNITLT